MYPEDNPGYPNPSTLSPVKILTKRLLNYLLLIIHKIHEDASNKVQPEEVFLYLYVHECPGKDRPQLIQPPFSQTKFKPNKNKRRSSLEDISSKEDIVQKVGLSKEDRAWYSSRMILL